LELQILLLLGGDIFLEKSNAKKVKDLEGDSYYAGVSVNPTLKGLTVGASKSIGKSSHSTAVSIGGSAKSSTLNKLIQPIETTTGRTTSTVLKKFDPTPDFLEKFYNYFK